MEKEFLQGYVIGKKKGISTQVTLITKEVTENGLYSARDDGADGYSSINVNTYVPTFGQLQVNSNGNYNAVTSGYDGFSDVEVNIPEPVTTVHVNANGNALSNVFNDNVVIDEGSTTCANLFTGFRSFNRPVTIPNVITNCDNMFRMCQEFNSIVNIPESVNDCSTMFYYCQKFNVPVNLPSSIKYMGSMFMDCQAFNQPITIPDNAINCIRMFYGCTNFNQPITFAEQSNSGTQYFSTDYMFMECTDFNQPINLPEYITNCGGMFYNCTSFNQPVSITVNANNLSNMFDGSGINQRIVLHSFVNKCVGLLANTDKFSGDICFKSVSSLTNVKRMLANSNRYLRKNIYTTVPGPFISAEAAYSITGTDITWTNTGTGLWYNSEHQIYIYNHLPSGV